VRRPSYRKFAAYPKRRDEANGDGETGSTTCTRSARRRTCVNVSTKRGHVEECRGDIAVRLEDHGERPECRETTPASQSPSRCCSTAAPAIRPTPGKSSDRAAFQRVDPVSPSPFASSLLFGYAANFLYDGDAPLAERRAQALSVDQAQLRDLIGDAELRDLFDVGDLAAIERQVQRLDPASRIRSADGLHDLLIEIGDLTIDEISQRADAGVLPAALDQLLAARRVVILPVAGERRYAAIEDVARYRDAIGVPLPAGLPRRSRRACGSGRRSGVAIRADARAVRAG